MNWATRKALDRSFTGVGVLSIALLAAALLAVLAPIVVRGARAVVFQGTAEFRRLQAETPLMETRRRIRELENRRAAAEKRIAGLRGPRFDPGGAPAAAEEKRRGQEEAAELEADMAAIEASLKDLRARAAEQNVKAEALRKEAAKARQPVVDCLAAFEKEMQDGGRPMRLKYRKPFDEVKNLLRALLGPLPGDPEPALMRDQFGQTRWDRAQVKLRDLLFIEEYDYSDPAKPGVKKSRPRVEEFKGTRLEPLFALLEKDSRAILRPRLTFYWGFFTEDSKDSHFFGGIWPELLGTFYLALGAMLFAAPIGVLSAIYLVEYAGDNAAVSVLRTFVSTLAGAPSIVFGLFGLAFFINTLGVSRSKSVVAGALTLGLLALPVVIRASEEAIKAVPLAFKEASLSLGASRWRTVLTVILPAALPGVLTGIVISMGRAAGETAPIIFTAAVSVGKPLKLWEVFSQPTPALSWNIYNLCTEHQAVDEIRHVQYGMALALVALALALNLAAIILRARISRKLKG